MTNTTSRSPSKASAWEAATDPELLYKSTRDFEEQGGEHWLPAFFLSTLCSCGNVPVLHYFTVSRPGGASGQFPGEERFDSALYKNNSVQEDKAVLFTSGEVTFYKDREFASYLLGTEEHEREHAEFCDSMVRSFRKGALMPITTDYSDPDERKILADFIVEECEALPDAMLAFRCDASSATDIGEADGTAKEELALVLDLLRSYSKRYGAAGFAVLHTAQVDKDGSPIPPHVHAVYTEPKDERTPTFSEYLHANL